MVATVKLYRVPGREGSLESSQETPPNIVLIFVDE